MSNLLKYEFRKALFAKLIILGITAVMEVIFLVGVFGEFMEPTGIGVFGLVMTAIGGITFIGVESIITLYRDLTTKQSYMLFMTPNSSYKILGAKTIENAAAVLLSGVFFAGLAYIDLSLVLKENETIEQLTTMVKTMLQSIDPSMNLTAKSLFVVLFLMLTSWILKIVTGYLAVVLTCTILSGRKGAAFISFVIYVAISLAIAFLMNKMPHSSDVYIFLNTLSVVSLGFSVIMYFVSAWIMDKKLSV